MSSFIFNFFQQILVEQYGYAFESHEVISDSGYILNLHRINRGKSKKKPVALFQHGIFSASDTWLFRGPKHDLRRYKKYLFYYLLFVFEVIIK